MKTRNEMKTIDELRPMARVPDDVLADVCRRLRTEMRPFMNELRRRGYTPCEVHGRHVVPVTGFENMRFTRPNKVTAL
jgi:hypothetical protein